MNGTMNLTINATGYARPRRRALRLGLLLSLALLLATSACAPTTATHAPAPARGTPTTAPTATPAASAPAAPTVDPAYIYGQLATMAGQFLHREAGYDVHLPADQNGHDEFAAYWTQEMLRDLQGFGPRMRQDSFPIQGWRGRPAPNPAVNVEVSVPGLTHPEQVVVIGCHYDGEAQSSQSAYDDASGCAIELGVARAMGAYWRARGVYPARTLRFVLFDAEEQGIFGSYHYVNETINGDLGNVTAMINEEQNGIAYPLRFLGLAANPQLPFYANVSPLADNYLYPAQNQLSPAQRDAIARFRAGVQAGVPDVFAQFRALGDGTLTYRTGGTSGAAQSIFAPDQTGNVVVEDDTLGGSDEIAFTLAGLPCVTFVGNSTYYFRRSPQPPWSYPYDQPQDTLQLMNTFASGRVAESPALVLALALPSMFTAWMLHQPGVLGEAAADGNPLAAIDDIGQTVAGRPLALDAGASFDQTDSGPLAYTWDFGDGTQARGVAVSHVYAAPGAYTLALSVRSARGARTVRKPLQVVTTPPYFPDSNADHLPSGYPLPNPDVVLPTPIG